MARAEMELEHLSKGKAVMRTQANAGLQAAHSMDHGTE